MGELCCLNDKKSYHCTKHQYSILVTTEKESSLNLYIAEKPSLAKAIVAALPKPHKTQKGFIEVGNGDVVSWCIGHILEQAEPQIYDASYSKWHYEHLPIIPQQWQLMPKKACASQLSTLKRLIKKSTNIIHAGDPDREGQLLVDEVIDYVKIDEAKKKRIKRLLISDLNTQAVKKALNQLQSNQVFISLSVSALARARADWLYGINLTRALTIRGQKSGFNSVLSVGRVQTPVLGLVVERDKQIEGFVPHDFYEVEALVEAEQNTTFLAKWQPSEACAPHMDEEGRITNKALAEHVIKRITGQKAKVTKATNQLKKQAPPLPYNLSALQIDAAKRYAMNAKLVLDVCQALYEKHKLITYPRSDCRYLPKGHLADATSIINMLGNSFDPLSQFAQNADKSLKSKAWNDAKVSAHHAIIPTQKSPNKVQLNTFEKNIYQLIARQYLVQFYPHHQYEQRIIELDIEGGQFSAKENVTTALGWKVLYKSKDNSKQQEEQKQFLPKVKVNQLLDCLSGELLTKQTQAPSPFNDASLLSAMTNIAKFVRDPEVKKQLKDTDGLGTEATRAGIIDLLFKRQYLKRQGKNIHATELGSTFIQALPQQTAKPDMTAHWESSLNLISLKQYSYQQFMHNLTSNLDGLIEQISTLELRHLPQVEQPKRFKRKRRKTVKKAK